MSPSTDLYDPRLDIAANWPEWRIDMVDLSGFDFNEVIDVKTKRAVLDPEGDEEWALSVFAAHLRLGHPFVASTATPDEQDDAEDAARLSLGIAHDRLGLDCFEHIPVDGEPTIIPPSIA